MDIVQTFGQVVQKLEQGNPDAARKLLRVGWEAMNLKLRFTPDKRLVPADRYLANMMMDAMLMPLKDPSHSAIVSIFTPCELLQEVGLHPYNAEAFSSYISGSRAEAQPLQLADQHGISDTFCSYHKIFAGAALSGLMPRPACIVHTNLICDANLVSFRSLAEHFDVPLFYIDVPARPCQASVEYVERQLRELGEFLQQVTGKQIDHHRLVDRVRTSHITQENFAIAHRERAVKDVKTDLVSPLYCAMTNNILLGTQEEARYVRMLLDDVRAAGPKRGKHIYWMHTLPYWSDVVYETFAFSDQAQLCGDELGQCCDVDYDPERPYEAMARRMVYNVLNGSVSRRIDAGIEHARQAQADGVVWLNQWGCKHTIGASVLAKRRFEAAGIPMLVLDGDGCDRSHGGEAQTATRLGAFLELLDERAS